MGILEMSPGSVYLLDDLAGGMPASRVTIYDKMEELKSKAVVIYFSTWQSAGYKAFPKDLYYEAGDCWLFLVKGEKVSLEMDRRLKAEKK